MRGRQIIHKLESEMFKDKVLFSALMVIQAVIAV